jgi:hypothetical protein
MTEDDVYERLFTKGQSSDEIINLLTTLTAANATEGMWAREYTLKLITALLVRISFIASVWLFVFNMDLWYGIPIFGFLSLAIGGVFDRNLLKKHE